MHTSARHPATSAGICQVTGARETVYGSDDASADSTGNRKPQIRPDLYRVPAAVCGSSSRALPRFRSVPRMQAQLGPFQSSRTHRSGQWWPRSRYPSGVPFWLDPAPVTMTTSGTSGCWFWTAAQARSRVELLGEFGLDRRGQRLLGRAGTRLTRTLATRCLADFRDRFSVTRSAERAAQTLSLALLPAALGHAVRRRVAEMPVQVIKARRSAAPSSLLPIVQVAAVPARWCGGCSPGAPLWSIAPGRRLPDTCRGPGRASRHGWEPAAIGLVQQAARRGCGGCLVRAGFPQAARLAGDWVGSGVNVHAERPAGQLFDVAAGGVGHGGTITRTGVIRSTTRSTRSNENVRITPLIWSRLSESNR
jgi:hypothetical protein